METEIQAAVEHRPAKMINTVQEVKAQMTAIADILRNVMQVDSDYGVIPGTDKPTLLKPGAEKLCVAFRIASELSVDDISGTTDQGVRHRSFRVKVRGVHIGTGQVLAEGIGEASTLEDKWAWRAALDEEYDMALDTHRRLKWKTKWDKSLNGGKGGKVSDGSIKQIRTNAEDLSNTVLKMAKKRAQIDMTLSATGASAIFTQDVEESAPEQARPSQAPTKPQDQRSPKQAPKPQPPAKNAAPAKPQSQPPAKKEDPSGGWDPDQKSGPTDSPQVDEAEQQTSPAEAGNEDSAEPSENGGPDLPLGEQDATNWKCLLRLRDAIVSAGQNEEKTFWQIATASKDPKYPAFDSEQKCINKIYQANEKGWKTTFIYIWLRQAQTEYLGEEEGKLIGSFSKQGVKLSQLEDYLGKALWNLDDGEVTDLWNVYQIVKDGTPFAKAIAGE